LDSLIVFNDFSGLISKTPGPSLSSGRLLTGFGLCTRVPATGTARQFPGKGFRTMSEMIEPGESSARPVSTDYDPLLAVCPLCGCDHLHDYHQDDKQRRIQHCPGCGIQLMNPQYSDAYLTHYYSNYIRIEPQNDEPNRFLHNYNLDLIENIADEPGDLLDIGCGRGHLLRAARKRGWQVTGFDVDPETVEEVATEFDLEIHSGDFMDLELAPHSFDVVAMHHVLEHLKDPAAVLRRVREILRPGGLLFVALPNIDGLSSTIKFSLEKMGLRKKGIGSYYDADHHLFYFSPQSLGRFLDGQGFKTVATQSAPKVRTGDSPVLRTLRRRTTDKLLFRSSFLVIAEKIE
jgi:2-polyprenyl-3-methyl-5-hydroxy-6-metoxy-1,4-benzoquinol methylase